MLTPPTRCSYEERCAVRAVRLRGCLVRSVEAEVAAFAGARILRGDHRARRGRGARELDRRPRALDRLVADHADPRLLEAEDRPRDGEPRSAGRRRRDLGLLIPVVRAPARRRPSRRVRPGLGGPGRDAGDPSARSRAGSPTTSRIRTIRYCWLTSSAMPCGPKPSAFMRRTNRHASPPRALAPGPPTDPTVRSSPDHRCPRTLDVGPKPSSRPVGDCA